MAKTGWGFLPAAAPTPPLPGPRHPFSPHGRFLFAPPTPLVRGEPRLPHPQSRLLGGWPLLNRASPPGGRREPPPVDFPSKGAGWHGEKHKNHGNFVRRKRSKKGLFSREVGKGDSPLKVPVGSQNGASAFTKSPPKKKTPGARKNFPWGPQGASPPNPPGRNPGRLGFPPGETSALIALVFCYSLKNWASVKASS